MTTSAPPTARPQLTHMGINVYDVVAMEKFYTEVIGMVVTDRGRGKNFKADLVFMSVDPSSHHQVVLASGAVQAQPAHRQPQVGRARPPPRPCSGNGRRPHDGA